MGSWEWSWGEELQDTRQARPSRRVASRMLPEHMPAVKGGTRVDAGNFGLCSGGWGLCVYGRGRSADVST
eukprot:687091-Prorocentrum_lima.AAC.1